jgi:hypothetical protein
MIEATLGYILTVIILGRHVKERYVLKEMSDHGPWQFCSAERVIPVVRYKYTGLKVWVFISFLFALSSSQIEQYHLSYLLIMSSFLRFAGIATFIVSLGLAVQALSYVPDVKIPVPCGTDAISKVIIKLVVDGGLEVKLRALRKFSLVIIGTTLSIVITY